MSFFRFKVSYYDVFEDGEQFDSGFVYAEDYADAAGKIAKWYGEDLNAIEKLYETDNDIVLLDENIAKCMKIKEN